MFASMVILGFGMVVLLAPAHADKPKARITNWFYTSF
jgi:hypothetical protein